MNKRTISYCICALVMMLYSLTTYAQNITITPNGSTSICEGNILTLTASGGYVLYYWNTGKTSQQVNIATAGWYWVIGIDEQGKSSKSDSLYVHVNQLPDKPTIKGNNNILTSSNATTYQWFFNDKVIPDATLTSLDITSIGKGKYNVVITDSNGCQRESDSYINKLEIIALGVTAFCQGDSVILQATDGFKNYLWSNGSTKNEAIATYNGLFSVLGINKFNDTVQSNVISVTVFPTPPKPTLSKMSWMFLCSNAKSYQWYHNGKMLIGENNRLLDYYRYGLGYYKVEINDSNGCKNVSDSIESSILGEVKGISSAAVSIIPNPVSDLLVITDTEQLVVWKTVSIIDNLGSVVLTQEIIADEPKKQIDVSMLSTGLYHVQLRNDKYVLHKPFVIER